MVTYKIFTYDPTIMDTVHEDIHVFLLAFRAQLAVRALNTCLRDKYFVYNTVKKIEHPLYAPHIQLYRYKFRNRLITRNERTFQNFYSPLTIPNLFFRKREAKHLANNRQCSTKPPPKEQRPEPCVDLSWQHASRTSTGKNKAVLIDLKREGNTALSWSTELRLSTLHFIPVVTQRIEPTTRQLHSRVLYRVGSPAPCSISHGSFAIFPFTGAEIEGSEINYECIAKKNFILCFFAQNTLFHLQGCLYRCM